MSASTTFRSSRIAMMMLGFPLMTGVAVTTAQASISVQEPQNVGTARISWGGADGLSQARSVMYSTPAPATATVRRVDTGATSNAAGVAGSGQGTLTYGGTAYQAYGQPAYGMAGSSDRLPISTSSSGAIVIDVLSGETLYEKNANIARPIASITKVMTAMVVLDAGLDMSEEIVLVPSDFVGPKRASSRLRSGDRLNRAELLLLALMKSENPAAKSLARAYPGGYDAFMRAMNQKAASLGMTSAFFGDPTGLDSRNVASPNDLVKMMRAAGNYDVIRRFSTTSSHDFYVANYGAGNRVYPASNTNYLVRDGAYPIGMSKTGYISEAGSCVVMETRVNNRPAIVVLLGAGSSTARWRDAETILNGLSMRRTI